jgi:WD40 repeat protein
MGINDFVFTSKPNEIITCSSDRTAKVWTLNFESKQLDEVRTITYSAEDDAEYKDNVEK